MPHVNLEQEFICLKCRESILKEYLMASIILETNNPKNYYFFNLIYQMYHSVSFSFLLSNTVGLISQFMVLL